MSILVAALVDARAGALVDPVGRVLSTGGVTGAATVSAPVAHALAMQSVRMKQSAKGTIKPPPKKETPKKRAR